MRLRVTPILAVLGLWLGVVGVIPVRTQSADPFAGTWELNVAQSRFSPDPPPKSDTRTYEFSGQTVKYTATRVNSDGKPLTAQYTASYDGKDYPLIGDPDSDAISFKRIDASTIEFTQKKAGKVVITGRRTLAKDGKAFTIAATGTNAKGQAINNVMVFEKR